MATLMMLLDAPAPPEDETGTMLVTRWSAMPLVVVPPRFSTSNTACRSD